MKILDEKGRIFGRVNLIDGIIVFLIFFIVIGGGVKVYQSTVSEPRTKEDLIDVIVQMENEAMPAELVAYLRPGGVIRPNRATEDGEIVRVEVSEPDIYYLSQDHLLIPVDSKYKKVTLEFKAIGEIYSNSLYLYGERVYLGQTLTLEAGMVRFNGTIREMRPLD